MDLDPTVRDKWGLPSARIHLDPHEHHKRAGEFLQARGLELLAATGAERVIPGTVGFTTGRLVHGTCRMGDDPATSVVDRNCRLHGTPSVYVTDGACLPHAGGVPSTMTIMANSFRVGEFIVAEVRGR